MNRAEAQVAELNPAIVEGWPRMRSHKPINTADASSCNQHENAALGVFAFYRSAYQCSGARRMRKRPHPANPSDILFLQVISE